MSQNRCLALASLIFVSLSCVRAARAQAEDLHPSIPNVIFAAANPSPVISAAVSPATDLPDDPSAPLQQSQPTAPQPADSSAPPAANPGQISSEDQLKQEEHHRVLGVMAAFNTTTNRDALPLTPGQKFQLFFKSQTDPWPFGLAAVIAGFNQAENTPKEYGQGMQGYGKRLGASYTDSFIGNFWGNAVLTSWWHEDPRYFQKGTGTYTHRFLWAATATVWCRRDNGSWGPNYANVAGNLIGAAIANVYYPASYRTVGDTITRGLSVTAQGIIGAEVIEFWPDIVRHYEKNRAAKMANGAAQQDAQAAQKAAQQNTSTPTPAGDPPKQP